jgi:nucleoside-diphosphate-sugar epimerase
MVVAATFFHDRPVLVTGATGFIGRRLVTALQERDAQVRALVRSISSAPPDWERVEIVAGDVADSASLIRACAGIDTVIHAAGFAHANAVNTPEFAARHWAINAEGTFRLLDTAVAAGVKRFIFLSSVKAVGEPELQLADECWNAPPETAYGQAKRAAEERVLAVGRTTGMQVVNLRPALVYGPGMKGNLPRLIEAVRRGWLPPLPETGNRRSLVHVDDVVQALLLAAALPMAAGQTYFVTDGQSYSGRELYRLIRRMLDLPEPRWTLPAPVFYGVAGLADGLLWLAGRRNHPVRIALNQVLGGAGYDSSRIQRELGYRPEWTLVRYSETERAGRRS